MLYDQLTAHSLANGAGLPSVDFEQMLVSSKMMFPSMLAVLHPYLDLWGSVFGV